MRVKSRYIMPPAAQTSTPDKVLRALEATVRRQKGAEVAYKAQLAEARRRIAELSKKPGSDEYAKLLQEHSRIRSVLAARGVAMDRALGDMRAIDSSLAVGLSTLAGIQNEVRDLAKKSPDASLRLIACAIDHHLASISVAIRSGRDRIVGIDNAITHALNGTTENA